MNREHEREKWLQDIHARQRNFVFPDTVQNEGRFFRNLLAAQSPNFAARVGFALLAACVVGPVSVFIFGTLSDPDGIQELLAVVIAMIVFFGPIFGRVAHPWPQHNKARPVRGVPRSLRFLQGAGSGSALSSVVRSLSGFPRLS